MRALLLALALVSGAAHAQVFSGGSSGSSAPSTACALAATVPAYAPSFRATTATDLVPGYACDSILTSCVKFGPGNKTSCGTNAAGENVCGLLSDSTGTWRWYGTGFFVNVQGVNVTATNVVTYGAAIDQGSNAFMRNPAGAKPVLTDDFDGQRLAPQVYGTFPTCGVGVGQLPYGTEVEVASSTTSAQRRCRCVATGGASSVPRWLNTNTNNYGATQSDCPESTVPGPPVTPNPGNPPGGPP